MGVASSQRMPSAGEARNRINEIEYESFSEGFSRMCDGSPASRYSGRVNKNQFREYVLSDFPEMPPMLADSIFNEFDVYRNGEIGLNEFVSGLCVITHGTSEERLRFVFNVYDVERVGRLTKPILVHFTELLNNSRLSSEVRWTTFAMIDDMFRSHDGTTLPDIGFDDFVYWSYKYLKSSLVSWIFYVGPKLSSQAMLGSGSVDPAFDFLLDESDDSDSTSSSGIECDMQGKKLDCVDIEPASNGIVDQRPRVPPESEARQFGNYFRHFNPQKLECGEKWFVVSLSWLADWARYSGFDLNLSDQKSEFGMVSSFGSPVTSMSATNFRSQSGSCSQSAGGGLDPGSIRNRELAEESDDEVKKKQLPQVPNSVCEYRLRPDVCHRVDYILVPEECWDLLDTWYGHDVELYGEAVNDNGLVELELYPITLFVSIYSDTKNIASSERKRKDSTTSTKSECDNGKNLSLDNNLSREIQVRVSKVTTVKQLMDIAMFQFCGRKIPSPKHRTDFSDDEGDALDALSQLMRERVWCILDEQASGPREGRSESYDETRATVQLLDQIDGTMEGYNLADGQQLVLEVCSADGSWPLERSVGLGERPRSPSELISTEFVVRGGSPNNSDSSATASGSQVNATKSTKTSPSTQTTSTKSKKNNDNGVQVGLQNLGNTCFLNASVQCLANTSLLTSYFKQGAYLNDMNLDSNSGTGGRVALAFGELIQNLNSNGTRATVCAPRQFKHEIGQFDNRFTGFQQQDAQEFLLCLLDALAQDLNKVKQKPYVELQDSNGRHDSEVAQEWWSNHLARELSIVTALFTGQYKSTIQCSECGFESARFEPFMSLSLPLPESPLRFVQIIVVFADSKRSPLLCTVQIPNTGTLLDAKLAVVEMQPQESDTESDSNEVRRLEADEMVFAQVFDRYIYSILPDDKLISQVRAVDHLFLYQLPETLGKVGKEVRQSVPPPPRHEPMQFEYEDDEDKMSATRTEGPKTLSWTSPEKTPVPTSSTRLTGRLSTTQEERSSRSIRASARGSIPSLSLLSLPKTPEQVAQRNEERKRSSHLFQQETHNKSMRDVDNVHPISPGARVLLLGGSTSFSSHTVTGSGGSRRNSICIVVSVKHGRSQSGQALESVLNGSEQLSAGGLLPRVESQDIESDEDDVVEVSSQLSAFSSNQDLKSMNQNLDVQKQGAASRDIVVTSTRSKIHKSGSTKSLGASDKSSPRIGLKAIASMGTGLKRPSLAMRKSPSQVSGKDEYYYVVRHVGSQVEEHLVPQDRLRLIGLNGGIHINVVQRQWHRLPCYFLNPYRSMLVDIPFVLRVLPEETTGLELYRLVARQLGTTPAPPYGKKSKKPKPTVESTLQKNSKATSRGARPMRKKWGFELRLVNQVGSSCGCCPWVESCFGCLIKDDRSPIMKNMIEADCTLAVDWGVAKSRRLLQRHANGMFVYDTHSSVRKVQEEQARAYSLATCVSRFATPEKLIGTEQVFCGGKCKGFTDQVKTIQLWRPPVVLIVHLKRFQHNSYMNRKLNNLIDFPLHGLDLNSFLVQCPSSQLDTNESAAMVSVNATEVAQFTKAPEMTDTMKDSIGLRKRDDCLSTDQCLYDLYGVVNHSGSLGSGHYFAYAKSQGNGKWRKYDDSTVTEIDDESSVVTSQAYLLFFIRRDMASETDINSVFPCEAVPEAELSTKIAQMQKLTAAQLSMFQRVKASTVDNCNVM